MQNDRMQAEFNHFCCMALGPMNSATSRNSEKIMEFREKSRDLPALILSQEMAPSAHVPTPPLYALWSKSFREAITIATTFRLL